MKRNPKGYSDISVLSALFDDKNPERKNLTRVFFNQTENFQIFISDLTLADDLPPLIVPFVRLESTE